MKGKYERNGDKHEGQQWNTSLANKMEGEHEGQREGKNGRKT